MKLQDLQAMGAFVPPKMVKREVPFKRPVMKPKNEWADPETPEFTGEVVDDSVTIHIRRGSSADSIEILQAEDRDKPFIAIHRCICDDEGRPVFPTLEKAQTLALWLALPLFEAITKEGRNSPKVSRRRTSSGAKSRSPSAAAASESGSTS